MKSSRIKNIVIKSSALGLIGLAVFQCVPSSDELVLQVDGRPASTKPSTQGYVLQPSPTPDSMPSYSKPPYMARVSPPPSVRHPWLSGADSVASNKVTDDLQPLKWPLIPAQLLRREPSDRSASPQEIAEATPLKTQPQSIDTPPTKTPDHSALASAQQDPQVPNWPLVQDEHVIPASANLSAPSQEFPSAVDQQGFADELDTLPIWGNEPSELVTSEAPGSQTPASQTPEHDWGTAVWEQPITPAPEEAAWSIDTLFEQIRNQRVTAAQHEVRWSLNDAILAALAYSNRVSALRIESIEELQNVGVQSGQFDVVGFAEQSFRDSSEPVGNTIDTASGVQPTIEEEDFNFAYGVRSQLRSGGEFELNQSFQIRDNDSGILVPRDQAISRFNARVTKELLRGAGRSIAMNEVLVAFHNASAQRAESASEIANHLNEVMTAYWDIYTARGALFAGIENRELAAEVLAELNSRQDIDAEPNLLGQAEATLRQRELQINDAHNDLIRAQIRLVSLVNAPELLENLNTIEILPQVLPNLETRGLDVTARINTAIQRRPEIADIVEQIKSAQVTHHVSLNELLPRLSLSLEASLNGLEGEQRLGTAFENQFDNDVTYQVGVNVEFPFTNRRARYNRRRTELVIRRLKADWQATIEQIKADVLDNAQAFSASQVRLEKQQEILQFSGSELKYLGLRKTVAPQETSNPSFALTQVLAAQDRQGTAKAAFVAAIADKHRAIFELNQATGILINPDVLPVTGAPPRPGFFSVYHQYIEERSKFADPAIALESQTRFEAQLEQRPGTNQLIIPPVPTVKRAVPAEVISYPLN